jgi:hypothetical protein
MDNNVSSVEAFEKELGTHSNEDVLFVETRGKYREKEGDVSNDVEEDVSYDYGTGLKCPGCTLYGCFHSFLNRLELQHLYSRIEFDVTDIESINSGERFSNDFVFIGVTDIDQNVYLLFYKLFGNLEALCVSLEKYVRGENIATFHKEETSDEDLESYSEVIASILKKIEVEFHTFIDDTALNRPR